MLMTIKTFMLFFLLLLALAGVTAAGLVNHWWGKPLNVQVRELPAAADEYARIINRYSTMDTAMDISGTIQIYDGEKDGSLKEKNSFEAVHYGRKYYWQLSYMRTYCDGNLILMVDTVHRRLQVSKLRTSGSSGFPAGLAVTLGSLFNDTSSFKLTGEVEEQGPGRILTIHSDFAPAVRVCRLYYDTASYRLSHSEIECWKDRSGKDTTTGKIWLAKVEYNYRPCKERDIGKEMWSYIAREKNVIKATGQYVGYSVMTNF
jgi:hypothetical protein